MPCDPTGHINLAELKAAILENFRANNADPEAFEEWQSHRNEHAKPYPMKTPIPVPPRLNPDGSEAETEPEPAPATVAAPAPSPAAAQVREGAESEPAWVVVPEEVLGLLEGE